MDIIKRIILFVLLIISFRPDVLHSQINWTIYPENPVIGGDFDPEALSIHRPCVLYDGDSYHMWYTSVRVFPIANDQLQLSTMGYATSHDGIYWQSVEKVVMGPRFIGDAFDMLHAGQGWVIAENDTFKMWYWGFNGLVGSSSIGYAWSLDGSNWTIVAGPGAFGSVYDTDMADLPENSGVAMPCVVKDGNTYHMWHSQSVDVHDIFRIGYARSSDGIHWTKVVGTGENGSVIDGGSPGSFDRLSASWPDVIKTDEGFMMWYSGYDGTISRIGCSISSDGIQWNPAPGLDATGACVDDFEGKYFENALGTCVILGDLQYEMWYSPENSNIVFLTLSDYATDVKGSDNPAGPESFTLGQNFPNPFNPSTKIEYSVKEPCLVNLAVYNLTGQIVRELINSYQQPGNYSITLNMQGITSGIYFYRIRMGDFQAVKKMVKTE
jgi:predicted GH43/DUF377 family glycosyl hydrolase